MRVELHDVAMGYGGGWLTGKGRRRVLDSLGLTIEPGQRLGIVGPSGAGKTTLGLILAGIRRPDRGCLCCDGVDLWRLRGRQRRRLGQRLQMVFQHPETTFDPRWTMEQSLAEAFYLRGLRASPAEIAGQVAAVELDPVLLSRHPGELSGGELQRMAIARALAMEPALLVLDEPTAMLDVLTQARIIHLLETVWTDRLISMVLISHDPALIDRFCPTSRRLDGGRLLVGTTHPLASTVPTAVMP